MTEPKVRVTLEYSADRAERTIRALREKFNMPRAGLRKLHQHAIRAAVTPEIPAPDPKECRHTRTIGDNYGQSCQNCGAQLAGYGYHAEYKTCLHDFWPAPGEPKYQVCLYCQVHRPTPTAE